MAARFRRDVLEPDRAGAVGAPSDWRPGLSNDGVHPTEVGARVWAGAVLDQVGR